MMKLFRNLMAMLAIVALSACATAEVGKVVKTASGATVQSVVSATLNGKSQLTEIYVPGKGYSHLVDRGPSVQGDIAKIGVSTVLPTAMNNLTAAHIAAENRRACENGGCGGGGPVINVQGGSAVSTSTSTGTATVTADISTVVGGDCGTSACVVPEAD